jgi:hypothetical protein
MDQFRIERNQYGNMYIYCRLVGCAETCVALRQYNRIAGLWE